MSWRLEKQPANEVEGRFVILHITCTWVADLKRNDAYAIDMLAPDTSLHERIAGIHGLSIDTIELYERNMVDELADGSVLDAPA